MELNSSNYSCRTHAHTHNLKTSNAGHHQKLCSGKTIVGLYKNSWSFFWNKVWKDRNNLIILTFWEAARADYVKTFVRVYSKNKDRWCNLLYNYNNLCLYIPLWFSCFVSQLGISQQCCIKQSREFFACFRWGNYVQIFAWGLSWNLNPKSS